MNVIETVLERCLPTDLKCLAPLRLVFGCHMQVSLPFFDANLAVRAFFLSAKMLGETRNLGGIPAITFTDKAIEPVMKVMHVVDLSECTPLRVGTVSFKWMGHMGHCDFWRASNIHIHRYLVWE